MNQRFKFDTGPRLAFGNAASEARQAALAMARFHPAEEVAAGKPARIARSTAHENPVH